MMAMLINQSAGLLKAWSPFVENLLLLFGWTFKIEFGWGSSGDEKSVLSIVEIETHSSK